MSKINIETPYDAVEIFGVRELVREMNISDVLDCYTDDEIFNECNEDDMADYLESRHFDFSPYIEEDEENYKIDVMDTPKINLLIEFCHQISPNGILMKEDMRRIINEYIDYLPNKCYSHYYNNPCRVEY